MAVKLKDAKITVKVDLQGATKSIDSLEERTKKQRADADKQEKAQKKGSKVVGAARGARGLVGAAVGGGLYQMVAGIVRSLPFGIGAVGAAGIAAAELNERYGPLIEGIMDTKLNEKTKQLSEILNIASWIINPLGKGLLEWRGGASGLSRDWSELKAELTSISAGLEAGVDVGAADILTGGTYTVEEFTKVFGMTREYAKAQTNLAKAMRRMNQRLIGEGITRSAKVAIEEALGAGSEQK